MSEEFEPSPRATKRRRTTRYSDPKRLLENGGKSPQDAVEGSLVVEDEVHSVISDTIEVNTNVEARTPSSKKSTTKRRANARTDNIDAYLSSDIEVASPIPNDLNSRGSTQRKDKDSGRQQNRNSPLVDQNRVPKSDVANAAQTTRSSGRARRPPKRLAELDEPTPTKRSRAKPVTERLEVSVSRTASPAPRGILTPSRKQKPKVQKSVAFNHEEKEIEEQLGFRDIDTPAPKKLPKKSTPYPSRSLKLSKSRESETSTVEEADSPASLQDNTEPVIVDDFLDTVPVPEISSAPVLISPEGQENPQFQAIKRHVLERLTSSSLPLKAPDHLDPQFKQLHSLLKSTVASSESNSLLLLGPRGAGKTMLLNLALRELKEDYPDEFHIVRLNGFWQTDDRLALREIWRQLGYSRNLEETETEDIGASYADTMASLLSLLSHADDMAVDFEDDSVSLSNTGQMTSKAIVFILDEFDLFTTHPRQTLLYNLFDIAQSRKAPIVVVGCSSRMDVIECLEKRVKSRFSHRWILVPGCKSLSDWESEVRNALTVRHQEADASKLAEKDSRQIRDWNTMVESQFLQKHYIQQLVKQEYYTTKSLPQLFIALHPLITALQSGHHASSTNKAVETREGGERLQTAVMPSVLVSLNGLPVLHLSLLISMCRLEAIHTLSHVNFNLVYTHYTELIDASRLKQIAHGSVTHSGSLRKWNRESCREAWEELGIEGLIIPNTGGRDDESNSGGAEMQETRMWRSEVGLDDIIWSVKEKFDLHGNGGGGIGEVLVKWCKEA